MAGTGSVVEARPVIGVKVQGCSTTLTVRDDAVGIPGRAEGLDQVGELVMRTVLVEVLEHYGVAAQ